MRNTLTHIHSFILSRNILDGSTKLQKCFWRENFWLRFPCVLQSTHCVLHSIGKGAMLAWQQFSLSLSCSVFGSPTGYTDFVCLGVRYTHVRNLLRIFCDEFWWYYSTLHRALASICQVLLREIWLQKTLTKNFLRVTFLCAACHMKTTFSTKLQI